MIFSGSIWINIFTIIAATLVLVVAFFKRRFSYWKHLNVAYLEPRIPFGNLRDQFYGKISLAEWFTNFYNVMKARNVIHAGFFLFHLRIYLPIDLDLIKRIMQVDFAHFTDHGNYINEKDDPLSAHLFALGGQKWRDIRTKLTPTFTSGKMKNMFPIMAKISQEFIDVLEEKCQSGAPIELKDMSARFTTDVIGSCSFGIDCNSLKDPETQFRIQGRRLLDLSPAEMVSNLFSMLFPNFSRILGLRMFPKPPTDFFGNVIKATVDYREQNDVSRNDLIQLLLDLKNNKNTEKEFALTYNELAAQAFGFFFAGFETSSTLMSFALLELALNEDVQNQLREEINTVLERDDDEITYDSLLDLRYMDMVLHETLRKYPPVPAVPRVCTKDYRVPGTDVIISKGITVFIPIRAIHYDPEYYFDPDKFDPTRFSDENKSKRHQFAYLPFGEGPRVCLETLRMYPPIPLISRVCTKDYKVPNIEIVIPEGMLVLIPVSGIHYDPEYYPDPEKFDPLRFSEENKGERHQFAYLPFGEGPRICLGT